jgi:predicted alpha/beta-fold hydrolase
MIIRSEFRPPAWLVNPHLQTLFAASLRPRPPLRTHRERIDLPDGDFLDVDWTDDGSGCTPETPIVFVLHGLTGSIESKYARGIMNRIRAAGWRAVLMHFRGASEEPNRLPRGYHSGETDDFGYFVRLIHSRFPRAPLAAVGYSLGGNVLLKWLGEQGGHAPLATAVAVSVPFDLHLCAEAIRRGFSRVYQARLLRRMRQIATLKFRRIEAPFPLPKLHRLRDFFEYDDAVTAPLHGFAGVDDYYRRCSSRQFLRHIRVPTLILHAKDDPFMSPEVVPREDELSDQVRLELSESGGHVGFVGTNSRGRPVFWLEQRIPAHLREYLAT